jgi:hypothetical protein
MWRPRGGGRAVHLDVPLAVCLERNERREGRAKVPLVGMFATAGRLVPPAPEEGFDAVEVVTPPAPA